MDVDVIDIDSDTPEVIDIDEAPAVDKGTVAGNDEQCLQDLGIQVNWLGRSVLSSLLPADRPLRPPPETLEHIEHPRSECPVYGEDYQVIGEEYQVYGVCIQVYTEEYQTGINIKLGWEGEGGI